MQLGIYESQWLSALDLIGQIRESLFPLPDPVDPNVAPSPAPAPGAPPGPGPLPAPAP